MPRAQSNSDRIASRMLATKVGAIRHGTKLFRGVSDDLDEEDLRRSARRVGKKLDGELEEFYDRRVGTIMEQLGRDDLEEPKRDPTLKFMRGDAEQFMWRSAAHGSIAMSRAHARTVARSGAAAAHNAAVLAIARANKNLVQGVMAMATLDNRTTELCTSRHGGAWGLDGNPLAWSSVGESFPGRPPWHFNCRTTLVPVFFDEDVPSIQEDDMDEWLDSEDAEEALGEERVQAWREGRMTRTQLVTGGGD